MPCYFIPAERSLPHEFSFYGQFRGSGRLEQKLAQNNDPMKQKKLWVKSFYCAAVLAALGLFFLLAMGSQFTVFACVLLGCAAFVFVDGLVTKNRK